MVDLVWPEDEGTGAAAGDKDDAANFTTGYYATGFTDRVRTGLAITYNSGGPDFDLSAGICVIQVGTVTADQTGEARDQGNSFVALLDSRSNISLTDSAVNEIYVEIDLSSDDTINVLALTSGTPSNEYLKIGEIDTSADTVDEDFNRTYAFDANIDLQSNELRNIGKFSMDDDADLDFGAPDYTLRYDSGNTQFELESQDIDGGGTTGDIFRVQDGTQDVDIMGDLDFPNITGTPSFSTHDHSEGGMKTIPNGGLTNSSVTVAGNSVSLGGSTAVALADLSDVGGATATDGFVIASDGTDYDGEDITSVTGAHVSLSDLSDVGTTSATDGHVVASDGTDFDSESITSVTEAHVALSDLSDVDTTVDNSQLTNSSVTVAGNAVSLGGSTAVSVDDLSDVASSTESAGQIPIWDATDARYENATLTGGNAISVTNADASVTLAVTTDSIQTDELDLSMSPPWTGTHDFSSGAVNLGFTDGSIPFSDGSQITQDNSNLHWDRTNNRLGIGTSTPDATHTIVNDGSDPGFQNTRISDDQFGSVYRAGQKARGSIGSPSAVQDNDILLYFDARGYDGNSYERATRIRSEVDGSVSDGAVPGKLFFELTDSSGSNTDLFSMDSSGRLGVGLVLTNYAIDVNGPISSRGLSSDPADPPNTDQAAWISDGTGTGAAGDYLRKLTDGGGVTNTLHFPHSPTGYSESNVTTDRTYDADSTSTSELADVLGTLIQDLRSRGLVG